MLTPEISQEIQQKLADMEAKKQKSKKAIKKAWLKFGAVIFVCASSFLLFQDFAPYIIGIAVIALIVTIIIHVKNAHAFKRNFKFSIFSPVINTDDSGVKYIGEQHITKEEFYNSGLYSQSADRYSGEDLFYGKRGKTEYKFSELHAEEEHTTYDSKGNARTTYVTIFRGIFMIADFNKRLKSTTRIVQARDGFFEKLFSGRTKVTLENPEFEEKFNTYSKDQVEARYILTPAMMEKIMELSELFKSKIDLCFKEENIYVALHSGKNHFELDTKQTIDSEQIERIYEEIDNILSIIDVLDLNTRIWTKR